MGLISSLSNAVSGLRVNQDSISVLSRNVSNAGTPGYHRQSLNIIDHNSTNATYARTQGINRAFSQSLQGYYNRQISDTASSSIMASYLDKLQGFMGKPGSSGSLDTMVGTFSNALQALATSPDDYPTRADVVAEAQALANRLNLLSRSVQDLRQDTETRILNDVNEANAMLVSLNEVNQRMLDLGMTDDAKSALHDQRDRLVAGIAEVIDVQANYRADGTVSLMTRSGVGLIDNGVSTFKFVTAGALSATTQTNNDPSLSQVGILTLTTPSGLTIDLVQQGVLQGGELAGLVQLRDKVLVETQNQLDEIAGALASVFSTISTPGTEVSNPATAQNGMTADLSHLKPGNDFLLTFTNNGVEQKVRVINSAKEEDYIDASGQRVIAVPFGDPPDAATVASALQTKMLGLSFSGSGSVLKVLDDGPEGVRDVTGLTTRGTATGTQQGEMAMALFTDSSGNAYTGNRDGYPNQITGFASRIQINSAVLADNRLLVQFEAGSTLGDASRPEYILNQLKAMTFVSGGSPADNANRHQLNGNLSQLVGQVLNYQGTYINSAQTNYESRQLTLDTIVTQMDAEYGVNIDEEMARLTELQSAYAANARVVSVVKELIDTLFAST